MHKFLQWLGACAIAVGLGTFIYIFGILGPRLGALDDSIDESLRSSEAATASLSRMAEPLDGAIENVRTTLIDTSRVLESSGETARKAKKGVTGLVLPKDQLQTENVTLKTTGADLRKIADDLKRVPRRAIKRVAGETHARLKEVRASYDRFSMPLQIELLVSLIACLHLFLGAFSWAAGRALSQSAGVARYAGGKASEIEGSRAA